MHGDQTSLLQRLWHGALLLLATAFVLSWAIRLIERVLPALIVAAVIGCIATIAIRAHRHGSGW